jgi:hypothetical protein
MAFTALFDACVLYPAPLRDLLMHLAGTGLFRARWTGDIHAEWMRAVLRDRPDLAGRLDRTRALMEVAVPDARIEGYDGLISALELPDPADRHVLAAAIVGRVDVIVTRNLRDFPAAALAPFRIEAQHPDVFIRHSLELDEATALDAVRRLRAALRAPPVDVATYLDTLSRQELPETVGFLRGRVALI